MARKSWNWETVYEALVQRFGTNPSSPLTWLYEPKKPDCAVLYSPDTKRFRKHPLHLHPGMPNWNPKIYKAILPALDLVVLEKKTIRKRSFLCCSVHDWKVLANALNL
jgi:hypothetical protein